MDGHLGLGAESEDICVPCQMPQQKALTEEEALWNRMGDIPQR